MKIKSIIIVLTVLLLGLVYSATSSTAHACSCMGPSSAKQVMEYSDVVFFGKVISITDPLQGSVSSPAPFAGRAVLFEAVKVGKGEPKAQYLVHTGSGGGDCGVRFSVGESVVVFATQQANQTLNTVSCSYWRVEGAPSDEVTLGLGSLPTSQVSWIVGAGLAVSLTAIILLMAITINRRRKGPF